MFIPVQSLIGALVSAGAIALLLFPRTALGLSFLVTILAFGLAYEWTHYLVHTDYRPKGRSTAPSGAIIGCTTSRTSTTGSR